MYNYEWDSETGGYILITKMSGVTKEVRPVFYEELDLLGFDQYWQYPKSDKPLLWAETRRYFYKGRLIAEATGGGMFSKPELKIHEYDLILEPVDISAMVEKNKSLMDGIVQKSLEIIYTTYNHYKDRKYDLFYVAFSGGKDSLVLLDLVQRALPHDQFKVVFGDTTMEISDTHTAVERAKNRWNTLEFYTAKSIYEAEESWKLFGPPSRTQRWCCSVHKSGPSLLLLRKLANKDKIRVLAFDGIRAEESSARANYTIVSDGHKHATQSNCSPIHEWGTSELFLYAFENQLFLNDAYRYGAIRVGCSVCPMSSQWWEFITLERYGEDANPFIQMLDRYARNKFSKKTEKDKYLNSGGWKGRMGGRELNIGGTRVTEQFDSCGLTLYVNEVNSEWKEWIKAIGPLYQQAENQYIIQHKKDKYRFTVSNTDVGIKVNILIETMTKQSIRFLSLFKNVFNKVAYCVGCQVCMVECPIGALKLEDNIVTISNLCNHCESCLDMPKGCLVAKSLNITMGGNKNMKGLNSYQHFGFRKEWLDHYIELTDELWSSDRLGKYQFDGFKVWMKEAEITAKNSITSLGKEIVRLGAEDVRVWAVILNNLAYNSTILKWYIFNLERDLRYEIKEIVSMLGNQHSVSTRENAITSLKETFKLSPIGSELGIGLCEMKGKTVMAFTNIGWQDPMAEVILYSLYKFAEKGEGYYGFTFRELVNDNPERIGISPAKIFGVKHEVLKNKIQGLAFSYPDFITVAFNKDLDNIDLNREKTSVDVLGLF